MEDTPAPPVVLIQHNPHQKLVLVLYVVRRKLGREIYHRTIDFTLHSRFPPSSYDRTDAGLRQWSGRLDGAPRTRWVTGVAPVESRRPFHKKCEM